MGLKLELYALQSVGVCPRDRAGIVSAEFDPRERRIFAHLCIDQERSIRQEVTRPGHRWARLQIFNARCGVLKMCGAAA